jgi:Probable zinc-ribbon domain
MKSGKQRRTELKAKKQARIEKRNNPAIQPVTAAWAAERGWIPINRTAFAPHNSFDVPDFVQLGYYFDRPFDCMGCNSSEIWTAAQQKWWYEEAKGNLFSIAKLCLPCRHQEQARRAEARRIHLEGIAAKVAREEA